MKMMDKLKKGAAAEGEAKPNEGGFHVYCTGQIESGQFCGIDNLYCRSTFNFGPDWQIVHGVDTGLTQIAQKANGGDTRIVWNFPIDLTFKSTNAFGWPRLVLSVYGIDGVGRDIVHGYASMHVPTTPGCHTRYVRLFKPLSSSYLQQFIGWLTGAPPEFFNPNFVSQSEGREVTRVTSTGVIKVQINIMTKGMQAHGYSRGSSETSS
jgi:B9 domain-containing protein 1